EGLMHRPPPAPGLLCVVCLFGLLDARPAGAQANPDFDAVMWTPLTCDAALLTALDPRAEIDLVGDALFPAAYVGRDATYLYLRYRVELTPLSPRGFVRNSDWTMLVQVPAGNPFQYQYQLSLDGEGDDDVEVWKNDPADDLTFSPIFTDESDTLLFSQAPAFVAPATAPAHAETPLSYTFTVGNGGSLAARGVVVTAAGLPPFVSSPEVTASSDDPSVTPTVVAADPPTVRVPALPIGATLTVHVSGTAALACTGGTTVVTASATNAVAASASAVLPVAGTPEVCDGMDNNCDGQVDEGGDA